MPFILDSKKRPAIDERLAKELERYKGQWVAIQGGHVVASGASATEAKKAAEIKGVTDPLVFRVSAHLKRLRV